MLILKILLTIGVHSMAKNVVDKMQIVKVKRVNEVIRSIKVILILFFLNFSMNLPKCCNKRLKYLYGI